MSFLFRSGESSDGWGAWSQWSQCSSSCGGGQQFRTRLCEKGDCEGPSKSARACNTQPCQGEWGCWTDWSACSVSCGVGKRTRTRDCLSQNECEGEPVEYQICEFPSCDCEFGGFISKAVELINFFIFQPSWVGAPGPSGVPATTTVNGCAPGPVFRRSRAARSVRVRNER